MNEKILVIDDEEMIRDFIQRALTRQGYAVKTVGQSREALEIIAKEVFDIIIIDLRMPEVNGMELSRKIKESTPQTSVIIITGLASYETEEAAKKLGIENYLAKPFGLDELRSIVKKCLEKH